MGELTSGVMTGLFNDLVDTLPKLLKALVVFIIGYLIIKMIAWGIKTVLKKSGIDKLKDKLEEIEFVSKSNIQFVPSTIISKIVYYLGLLGVILISADILAIQEITELLQDIIRLIPNLIVAVIILIIGLLIGESIRKVVLSTCQSLGIPAAKIIASFVFFFVVINALMIALKKATIPTQFLTDNLTIIFAGIIGAFAVGYGIASKSIMSNFLSSYYSKGKINLGDKISIENITGEVIAMDSTTITIASDSGRTIIPLSKFTEENITIHDK